jgi:N utilization substance protein A
MNKDLLTILEYLEREKGIKRDVVIKALEEALILAAKKGVQGMGNVQVKIDPKTGDIEAFVQKTIVEEVDDDDDEISLEDAQALTPDCQIGQRLEILVTPKDLGRIAAQTARQVIMQRLRGAERDVIYEEYRHRVHEIISGTVKNVKGRTLIVDLGKVEAILPDRYYPKTEHYHAGERVQALLLEVHDTDNGGAEVILTRSHPEFVQELFAQEVPELQDGTIAIEKIVRDPGYRTKIAVRSFDPKVDPVGTCVGVRGTRIKNVLQELGTEKIDVLAFSDDPIQLLRSAMLPTEPKRIKITDNKITVIVADDDYPVVIGKRGMNARLIAQLVKKEIDIQKISEYQKFVAVQMVELAESTDVR